jgi:(S)-2-hydroxyglutarate dehydrogenase
MRLVVVGGGIVGLATARLLACELTGADVLVLEKDSAIARHQTARNSGVIHAGLYYAPGSLKARLCRRGGELLRDFCAASGIRVVDCGKVVVAVDVSELDRLHALAERAAANGVTDLRLLDSAGITAIEPHARGLAGLHSPRTAIVDFAAVARALAGEVSSSGGQIRTAAAVRAVRAHPAGAVVELADGERIAADGVIVCAGLYADRLARASGEDAEPRIVPFLGEYWKLRQARTELVRGLIYPVPDPRLPFLGVHLTRTIAGEVWIGPNAILAGAREGYRRAAIKPREVWETLSWPGTWRLVRRYWKVGLAELERSLRKSAFARDAARYVPELHAEDAVRGPVGVRAQAVDRDGTLVDDFRLSGTGRVVWVRNAPSPAATSSLAIAEELVQRLQLH